MELGIGAPREGLYIREDVKMKCNIMMISFVKKTFKESHSCLVDRLVEKAHINENKAANERLNTLRSLDPKDRMGHGSIYIAPPPDYKSPQQQHLSTYSNESQRSMDSPSFSQASTLNSQQSYPGSPPPHDPRASYHPADNRASYMDYRASFNPDQRGSMQYLSNKVYDPSQSQQMGSPRESSYPCHPDAVQHHASELPSEAPGVPPKTGQHFAAELATDPQNDRPAFTAELPA